jgi:cytoskeletal protein RodZ
LDLQQFCENLKSARLYQELKLDEVARETRIPPQYLSALEEGNWHLIPAGYLHGYLGNYARSVGMNLDRVLESFEDLEYVPQQQSVKEPAPRLETQRPALPEINEKRIPGILEALPLLRWLLIGAAATVLLIVVGGLFLLFNRTPANPREVPSIPPPVEKEVIDTVKVIADSSTFVVEKVNLALTFTDSCYLKVSTDDSLFGEKVFLPGDSVFYSAEGYFNVVVGNPQAAQIYFNGRNAGRVGQTNRPAHLLVDPAGIRQSSLQDR